ncbi:MAG: hypothetical protein NBV65_01065 [Burkholderiaceae bacterium]|nr:hypothetical protein [Burkholderiaceae bacterium]
MADPIPNLYDKYGGTPTVAKIVKTLSTNLLTHVTLKRYFEGMPTADVAAANLELLAMALGHPAASYDPAATRPRYASLRLTTQAYEEMLGILRHALLGIGFESRDATIAINVLDMHAEALLGIRPGRKVTSPFAGVDRRRRARDPETTSPSQRREF